MTDSDTPSQERDGRPAAQQSDSDAADTATPSDTDEDPRVAAAMDEADDALTRAAESHDDYREAITDAVAALDEVDRLHGRDVPGETADAPDTLNTPDTVSEADLDTTAAPEHTDGTGHLELYYAGQVLVRAARTLKRSRAFPQSRAAGLVQTSARASIHLCHEDVPEDALADVATEAVEGVGDLADLARDSDATDEQVAEAATELFEILSKVEEVRAASDARGEHNP
jgi:hypothetical protein